MKDTTKASQLFSLGGTATNPMTNTPNPVWEVGSQLWSQPSAANTHSSGDRQGEDGKKTRDIQMHHIIILPTKTNFTTSVFWGVQQDFR